MWILYSILLSGSLYLLNHALEKKVWFIRWILSQLTSFNQAMTYIHTFGKFSEQKKYFFLHSSGLCGLWLRSLINLPHKQLWITHHIHANVLWVLRSPKIRWNYIILVLFLTFWSISLWTQFIFTTFSTTKKKRLLRQHVKKYFADFFTALL